jgi:hypothetical protein
MPAGATYVGRPTRWGNPYRVGDRIHVGPAHAGRDTVVYDAATAVDLYHRWIHTQRRGEDLVPLLRGRDLACWCPLSAPCHADVLLELANR